MRVDVGRGCQENVVEETAMMVPDTCTRLQNAVADLAALLVRRNPNTNAGPQC